MLPHPDYTMLHRSNHFKLIYFTDPPGIPEITGKSVVTLGNEQKLTCMTKAGNPPAKLSWYRGSSMIESRYSLEGDIVKAEVQYGSLLCIHKFVVYRIVWKQVSRNLLSTISDVFYCHKMHSYQIWLHLVQ